MSKFFSFLLILGLAGEALAADKLVIISPHRKTIQREFIPLFKTWYKDTYKTEVEVDWLDQGGTSDDVRFIRARYAKKPASSGVDIFWGGGSATFTDLADSDILVPVKLPAALEKQLPAKLGSVELRDAKNRWFASAMSSFGMFYNKKVLKFDGVKAPVTWGDLGKPEYFGMLSLTDPRRSGTANTMNSIIVQNLGWDKGWELLTAIGGNTRSYTHSSSDPIKAVVSGDASVAMAIDFYAMSKVGDLGAKNLGFALPQGSVVIDPDPVGVLKGAPNKKVATRFVEFVLSARAQQLLILPKGTKNGPKVATLGRMSVNKQAYAETEGKRIQEFNPFGKEAFASNLDVAKAAKLKRVFNDMFGALIVDKHKSLKKAWKGAIKGGVTAAELANLGKVPVTEAEALKLIERWDDNVFRNKKINEWINFASKKYEGISH